MSHPLWRFQILRWDNSTLESLKIAHGGFSVCSHSGEAGQKSKSPAVNNNS